MKAQPIADDTLMLAVMVAEGFKFVSKLNDILCKFFFFLAPCLLTFSPCIIPF